MELNDNSGVSKTIDGVSTIELGNEVPDEYWHCLLLPQKCNRKERMEAIGSLFGEMMIGESLRRPVYGKDTTENNIPIEFAQTLRSIGRLVGYMVNCHSWYTGEMMEFDKMEILKRIKNIQLTK
jgi:hypothetical protein